MNWNQHSYQLYFSETLYYLNEFFGFFVLFCFFYQRITLKKKKIDSMVELQRLTYPESLLLNIFDNSEIEFLEL